MPDNVPYGNSTDAGASCSLPTPSDPCGTGGKNLPGSCQPGSVGHVPKAGQGTSNCGGSLPTALYTCPEFNVAGGIPGSVPVSQM